MRNYINSGSLKNHKYFVCLTTDTCFQQTYRLKCFGGKKNKNNIYICESDKHMRRGKGENPNKLKMYKLQCEQKMMTLKSAISNKPAQIQTHKHIYMLPTVIYIDLKSNFHKINHGCSFIKTANSEYLSTTIKKKSWHLQRTFICYQDKRGKQCKQVSRYKMVNGMWQKNVTIPPVASSGLHTVYCG